MYKSIKFLTIALAVLFVVESRAIAQNTSSATMQVRVEVVSGSQITQAHTSGGFAFQENETTFGEFNVQIPEGTQIITESENTILMINDSDLWKMNSELKIERRENGSVNMKFVTQENVTSANSGSTYRGKQVATIQYL